MAETAGLDFLPENLLAKLNCGIGLARPFDMKNMSNINFASCIPRSILWTIYISSFALTSYDASSGSSKTLPRKPVEVRLFENGIQVENYRDLVEQILPDDVLIFDGQRRFEVVRFLGAGNSTRVLEVKHQSDRKTLALRIPKFAGKHTWAIPALPYTEYINIYLEVAAKFPLLVPQVHDSLHGQFALVDLVNVKFLLSDAIQSEILYEIYRTTSSDEIPEWTYENGVLVSLQDTANAYTRLADLGVFLAPILWMADVEAKQVAFDGNRWWILDFGDARLLQGDLDIGRVMSFPLDYIPVLHKRLKVKPAIEELGRRIQAERIRIIASGINPLTGAPLHIYSSLDRDPGDQKCQNYLKY